MTALFSGYTITATLYEGTNSRVLRGHRLSDTRLVILKVLKDAYRSPERLAAFKREYQLIQEIHDLPGVPTVYALERERHGWAMVLEDIGGQSLTHLNLAGQINQGEVLQLAIQLADILGQIHQRHLIHCDINPSNIILNPLNQQLQIIDFGVSSRFVREVSPLEIPPVIESTPAYMSPEQTGRMNRGIDHRTDLYSLGITLYELLTGRPPFVSDDVLELVHSHIARHAPPPHLYRRDLPPVISAIVLKLLAKNPQDRYQSAHGLKADLQVALQRWQATGTITAFLPGQHDIPERFQISQNIYGREAEMACVLNAFELVSQGASELLLLAGQAGVGKSKLVHALMPEITRQHGLLASSKCDQLQFNIPYAPFIEMFQTLTRHLLREDNTVLAAYRERILTAVGGNGQVIIDVIPDIVHIIGEQPTVPELPPMEAQNRLALVFGNFVRALAYAGHPLVLFIDDIHWADAASLRFLRYLLTTLDNTALLVVGAYRTTEPDAVRTITDLAEAAERAGVMAHTITLQPLTFHAVNRMISDTLHTSLSRSEPLAELIHSRTGGNPFFLRTFLQALHTHGRITFNYQQGQWQWHLEEIQAQGVTDNVSELLISSVEQLPAETRAVLKLAACIGHRFDLATLALVADAPQNRIRHQLEPALDSGLIIALATAPTFVEPVAATATFDSFSRPPDHEPVPTETATYVFAHDRIHSTIYDLMAEDERTTVHWTVGQVLWRAMLADNREPDNAAEDTASARQDMPHVQRILASTSQVFDMVNHFDRGLSPIATGDVYPAFPSLVELIALHVLAGKQARAAAAFESAFSYLRTATDLLEHTLPPETAWTDYYALILELYQEAASAAYLTGDMAEMERLTGTALEQATTTLDRAAIYELRVRAYIASSQLTSALQASITALRLLDLDFPAHPTHEDSLRALRQTAAALEGRSLADLIDLPALTDPIHIAALRLLSAMTFAAYVAMPDLLPLVTCRAIDISIQHGNAAESSFVFALYGLVLCGVVGDVEAGGQAGQLALRLIERFGAHSLEARTSLLLHYAIQHWQMHLNQSVLALPEVYRVGLQHGDLEYAAIALHVRCVMAYYAAMELPALERLIVEDNAAIRRIRQERHVHVNEQYRQVVLNLMGQSDNLLILRGEAYDEDTMQHIHQQAADGAALFGIPFHKLSLCCLFHDYQQAIYHAAQVERYLSAITASPMVPHFYFYDSLARLGAFLGLPTTERPHVLARIEANQKRLHRWAQQAPMNYLHKYHLVAAELARVQGNPGEAREYYDLAADLAYQHGYTNDEALAYELAGRFYLAGERTPFAQVCFREARQAYMRWGALAKVQDLETTYPLLLTREGSALKHDGSGTTPLIYSSGLDLSSVVKASQTISGEIVLDALLAKLMRLIIENAGAQRGALILENGGQWAVEAEGHIEHQTIDVLHTIPIERATVPASIINFVIHAQQSLVLDDAAQGDYATHDPYIREQRPHSVLCMPLIHHGDLVGVLYLENNLATGVFTAERLEVLRLLSGQVAISIENARLYQQMQTLVSDLQCSRDELALAYDATLEGWVRMLDLRDNETRGHSQRVTRLTVRLAQSIGVGEDELLDIYRGALLHDIGKMAIPDHILHKPGPLTDDEWKQMRQHPVHAYEALWPIDYLRRALDIPYCHHERWDGTGYPRGLRGDAIPLAARIFAVIDVWDALRSDRPYRAAWPEAQVRAYVAEHAGTHFDPAVVVAFFRLLDTTDASDLIS